MITITQLNNGKIKYIIYTDRIAQWLDSLS